MLYKNLTVKELFATLYATQDVVELFEKGLRRNNDRLAGSAMEELIRRGDTDSVVKTLDEFYAKDEGRHIPEASGTLFVLMRDLADSCRKEDALLGIYANEGAHLYSPTEWIKQNAERFKKVYRSGAVINAKPWAKQYLK